MQSLLRSRRDLRTENFVWFVGIATRMLARMPWGPEGKYLEALEGAERFTVDGSTRLDLTPNGTNQPLRLMRMKPCFTAAVFT